MIARQALPGPQHARLAFLVGLETLLDRWTSSSTALRRGCAGIVPNCCHLPKGAHRETCSFTNPEVSGIHPAGLSSLPMKHPLKIGARPMSCDLSSKIQDPAHWPLSSGRSWSFLCVLEEFEEMCQLQPVRLGAPAEAPPRILCAAI